MKKIADNMWAVDRPFRFFIANLGVRMTVIKLNSGGLMRIPRFHMKTI